MWLSHKYLDNTVTVKSAAMNSHRVEGIGFPKITSHFKVIEFPALTGMMSFFGLTIIGRTETRHFFFSNNLY